MPHSSVDLQAFKLSIEFIKTSVTSSEMSALHGVHNSIWQSKMMIMMILILMHGDDSNICMPKLLSPIDDQIRYSLSSSTVDTITQR